jgi:integrase
MSARHEGHVEYVDGKPGELGHYRVRLRLEDGSRPYVHLDPSPRSPAAERRAREKARAWMERVRSGELVLAGKRPDVAAETVSQWFERYLEYRASRGQQTVGDSRGRFVNWIEPVIGKHAMAAVTAEQLEDLVAILDAAVDEERISWKTAKNVWGEVTAAFNQACRSKRKDLRVRQDNPVLNVPGPDGGQRRRQPILYPDEVATLLACERVDLRWREVYALAVYTGARAGELSALRACDLDLVHRRMTIARQQDRTTGELRLTKTKSARSFDIEPAVLPLVERLARDSNGGALVHLSTDSHRAKLLRTHLEVAGITRRELFVCDDPTQMPFTFHGLRHTHLTWMAVRGDDAVKIQMRAGHTDFKMTQRYVEAARTLGGGFGVPFPELAADLVAGRGTERRRRALTDSEVELLRDLACRDGAGTLADLRRALQVRTGKRIGIATIWREMRA